MAFSNASNRILYDVPCAVCRDHSSGKHYGVFACDGCAGFFKRSVRRDRQYACKARAQGRCLVDKAHRNQCRACRLAKCLDVGMNRDAVQHERGPRNSTIRRQMALYFRDRPPQPSNRRPLPPPPPINLIQQNVLAPLPSYVFPNAFYTRLLQPSPPMVLEPRDPSPSHVPTPMLMQSEADALCETGARLLFMNIKWVKSLPAFTSLSLSDRLLLLEESWRELFVLATAQMVYPVNLRLLYNPTMGNGVLTGLEIFESALEEIARVRPDSNEFSNLRALMLFKTRIEGRPIGHVPVPGVGTRLQDVATIAALQDSARIALNEYAVQSYPMEQARIGQLFQLLHFIRQVPSTTIVELFFRATIGEIDIEKIICDMYTSEKSVV